MLDGSKKFITRASTADWLMVVARLQDHTGFVGLLVPRDAPGLTISPEVGKLGWFGVPISSLRFDAVRVPASHRLGEEGDGFSLALVVRLIWRRDPTERAAAASTEHPAVATG